MAIDFFRENHYNMIDTIKNGCPHIKKTAVKERKVSMKKRILAAILSGTMVITGISACSGNAATSSENSSASTTTYYHNESRNNSGDHYNHNDRNTESGTCTCRNKR